MRSMVRRTMAPTTVVSVRRRHGVVGSVGGGGAAMGDESVPGDVDGGGLVWRRPFGVILRADGSRRPQGARRPNDRGAFFPIGGRRHGFAGESHGDTSTVRGDGALLRRGSCTARRPAVPLVRCPGIASSCARSLDAEAFVPRCCCRSSSGRLSCNVVERPTGCVRRQGDCATLGSLV